MTANIPAPEAIRGAIGRRLGAIYLLGDLGIDVNPRLISGLRAFAQRNYRRVGPRRVTAKDGVRWSAIPGAPPIRKHLRSDALTRRALSVLRHQDRPMTATEIAIALEVPRSQLMGYLVALWKSGRVARHVDRA